MQDNKSKALGTILIAIVAALGGLAVIHMLIALPVPDGKGPEWIGAIGTVLTLVGTIWLATAETRNRHREELMRARLRAASMTHKVFTAQNVANKLCSDLQAAAFFDQSATFIIQSGEELDRLAIWSTSDVEPLISLPNNVAALLAQSADELESVKAAFSRARAGGVLGDRDARHGFSQYYSEMLERTIANLDICILECVRAREYLHRPNLESPPMASP